MANSSRQNKLPSPAQSSSYTLFRPAETKRSDDAGMDIPEGTNLEASLKAGEELFRASVEALLDGFAIFTSIRDNHDRIIDFRYEYINDAGCRLNQRSREDLVGHTLLELFPAQKDLGLIEAYAQVVETGEPLIKENLVYEDIFGNGQRMTRVFDLRTGKLGDGFVVAWRDVTEKKRIEESERRTTPDGEVATERVRMPSWSGDRRVMMEREVRTKKLPDGTVEKEYVLKNPDGADRLVPIEIIRERIKKSGDATTVEREVFKPDFQGHWKPTRRETVSETGGDTAKQSVQEIREPTVTGEWKVVDRQLTSQKSSGEAKESRSVRQLPDAYGRLADYEVREERATIQDQKENREVTVRRRDFQDTHHPKFYLVERTVSEQRQSPDGTVTVQSTKESDLLGGAAARNIEPGAPRAVEERTEKRALGEAGTEHTVLNVKERGLADPEMRRSYQVIQQTDRDGHVRQLFIPLR